MSYLQYVTASSTNLFVEQTNTCWGGVLTCFLYPVSFQLCQFLLRLSPSLFLHWLKHQNLSLFDFLTEKKTWSCTLFWQRGKVSLNFTPSLPFWVLWSCGGSWPLLVVWTVLRICCSCSLVRHTTLSFCPVSPLVSVSFTFPPVRVPVFWGCPVLPLALRELTAVLCFCLSNFTFSPERRQKRGRKNAFYFQ